MRKRIIIAAAIAAVGLAAIVLWPEDTNSHFWKLHSTRSMSDGVLRPGISLEAVKAEKDDAVLPSAYVPVLTLWCSQGEGFSRLLIAELSNDGFVSGDKKEFKIEYRIDDRSMEETSLHVGIPQAESIRSKYSSSYDNWSDEELAKLYYKKAFALLSRDISEQVQDFIDDIEGSSTLFLRFYGSNGSRYSVLYNTKGSGVAFEFLRSKGCKV